MGGVEVSMVYYINETDHGITFMEPSNSFLYYSPQLDHLFIHDEMFCGVSFPSLIIEVLGVDFECFYIGEV